MRRSIEMNWSFVTINYEELGVLMALECLKTVDSNELR